jgi:hypothetical protein
MEITLAWWCCWNVAHTRLLHSCSLRRSRWGTSVLGIAMQLKLHPTRTPRSCPHTTMVLLSKGSSRPQLYRLRTGLVCGTARRHLTNNGFFRVSEEVRDALNSKKPVVALETTIYTHGRMARKRDSSHVTDGITRVSLSRKRSPRVPSRKRSSDQRWSSRDHWHIGWCSTCWYGPRGADKISFFCWPVHDP